MYIEEVTSLRADLPPSQDTRVFQLTKNLTLILLDGQMPGNFCGLPHDCPCPIEHSIYFSPGKLVFDNNSTERVFKYKQQDLLINFKTNSTSVSSYCRKNHGKILNDLTQLSWKNVKTGIEGFRKIPGYLSDVEFFTYNGLVYVTYCEYYDPVFDTHELYCTVLRSNDQNYLEEIQRIPVKGAWKIHLLHTAQGIDLIIGNIVPGISNYTDIYRFHPIRQNVHTSSILCI